MNGAGTQENPYIVTTMGDLITAAGTPGAHVELGGDINVSQDAIYKHGLTSALNFACASFDGKQHSISNAKISSGNAITFTGSVVVSNAKFLNYLHVPSNDVPSNGTFTVQSNSDSAIIQNCDFSFAVAANGYKTLPVSRGQYKNCSLYFTEISGNIARETAFAFDFSEGSEYNNVEVHRFGCKSDYTSSPAHCGIIQNCDHASVVGDYSIEWGYDSDGYSYVAPIRNCSYCLVCCEIASLTNRSLRMYRPGSNSYWVTDLCTGYFLLNDGGLTSEQAKSQAYLTSIGFLP